METCPHCHKPLVLNQKLFLDEIRAVLDKEGKCRILRPTTWELLCILRENFGRVVPREKLVSRFWPNGYSNIRHREVEEDPFSILKVHVHILRRYLEGTDLKITGFRMAGYKLEYVS